jgi:hypothetical protein
MAAASVLSWMRFLSFYWGAIAVARHRFCIYLFGALPMQVATTAQQTLCKLLAGDPDMAKVLAVIALLKASLSFVQFPLDNNIFKAVQLNYS